LEQNTTGINYRTGKRTNQEEVPKERKKKVPKRGGRTFKNNREKSGTLRIPCIFQQRIIVT